MEARCIRWAFFLALSAVPCAYGREPVRSLLEIRQANVVAQKWDTSCGAAALATLFTYHLGDPVPERRVVQSMLGSTDALKVKVRGGFSLLDLKRYAQSRGLSADGYANVALEDLQELGPSIVPVVFDGYPHFVVFRGRSAGRVLLSDPAYGNRSVAVEEFQKAWQKVAFVVERPGDRPASALGPELQDELKPSTEIIRSAVLR